MSGPKSIFNSTPRGLNYPLPFESSTLWNSAEWVWSSTEVNPQATGKIEDLALYFATSGFYHCRQGCPNSVSSQTGKSRAKFDAQLNNAPASVSGHVVRFRKPGKYFYICTRYAL